MNQGAERRRAPRISKQLPLVLRHARNEFVTKTENVSASGAYCTVTRYVAPMTKLKVRLELPDASSRSPRLISGEGVVVRVEPPYPTPRRRVYHIAIFFNELSERSRGLLAAYVEQHLAPTTGPSDG